MNLLTYQTKENCKCLQNVTLCSQNFSDKEFTHIPLQTMMLVEAFVNELKEYCSNGNVNLPEKFNLLILFKKFWGKKCDIYFSEKLQWTAQNQKQKAKKNPI